MHSNRMRRFLRAHGGSPERALEAIRWCVDFRTELQMWNIEMNEVKDDLKLGKFYCRTLDKEGHPVIMYRTRRADHTLNQDVRMRALVLALDQMERRLDRGDWNEEGTWVVVLDMTGKSQRGSMSVDYFMRVVKLFVKCYPGRLHRLFIVDANFMARRLWSLACSTRLIEEQTVNKVCFVCRIKTAEGVVVVPELLQQVGSDRLEEEYGGRDRFEWEDEKHWDVIALSPKPLRRTPLLEAARLAACETASTASSESDTSWFDAMSVTSGRLPGTELNTFGSYGHAAAKVHQPTRQDDADLVAPQLLGMPDRNDVVVDIEMIAQDCELLKYRIEHCDRAGTDRRLARLSSELDRFVRDYQSGNAETVARPYRSYSTQAVIAKLTHKAERRQRALKCAVVVAVLLLVALIVSFIVKMA
eukprot:gnl/TRDRNA2_/TRDRNA2_92160_c0_seq2.p1 gnl/TRDRNA2_/TRDRNA2_92160_c0~~gnl/TRDRNA2_/TRDRNA2_92160_c0_seq2.p1  ORF type:complete len:416 (+),score=69.92 gnl/TRDRNA2_/TRDRNA2_92160_c0_seq2:162-1409(+)